jgi:hypothetical protein
MKAPLFPDRCVCCGAPKERESTLAVNGNVMRKNRQVQVESRLQIPHCRRCARSTRSIFMAGFISWILGFLVAGIAAFVLVAFGASGLGLDEHGRSDQSPSLILGVAAGLFAGLAGGLLFELAGRALLFPIFGRGLLRAPMLALQMLRDADYVAGIAGRLASDAAYLELGFENLEIAREFVSLNPAAEDAGG